MLGLDLDANILFSKIRWNMILSPVVAFERESMILEKHDKPGLDAATFADHLQFMTHDTITRQRLVAERREVAATRVFVVIER